MNRSVILALAFVLPACTMHYVPVAPVPVSEPAATKPLAAPVASILSPTTAATGAAMPSPASLQVWVDDLDLTKATHGWNNPVQKNLSAENNPLTLKGKTFAHSIGTHAESLIVIDVKGAGKTFSATVGIDDDANDEGSCGFSVIGDGKVLAKSGTINRADPVKQISVDITGVKQLVLQVDGGDDDNINNDHGDWAEPLITLDPAHADAKPVTVPATDAKLP